MEKSWDRRYRQKDRLSISMRYLESMIVNSITSTYAFISKSEEKVCLICYTEKINTIVIPCKHMCLCMECAELLRNKTR